jgi:hypothetical protein
VRKVDMEEDLAKQWERFNLLDAETEEVEATDAVMEPLVNRGTACVVGKLLADRILGKEVLKTPLIRAWQPTGWVSFKNLGPNLFLIEFKHEEDKIRIMEGRPWKVDGDLFSMVDFDGQTPPSELEFEKATFWVRMLNMPLACMSREMGQKIGASMGTVVDVDVDEDGVGWGKFLRVRIILDLTKPLSRGRFLRLRDRTTWITFQYERIPRFCFKCGVIRHGGRGCVRPGGRRLQENENMQEFGPWLRVPSSNRNGGGEGGGRGKFNGDRRGYAQPPKSDTWEFQANWKSKQGETMVAGGDGNDDGSSDSSPATAAALKGKFMSFNEEVRYTQGSEISGMKKRKEGAEINMGIKDDFLKQDSFINDGAIEGNGGIMENKETISSNKGKNVYIGQWDDIREKMTWQVMEKGNDVSGNTYGVTAEHVDSFSTPDKVVNGGGTMKSSKRKSGKKAIVATGTLSQAGNHTVTHQLNMIGGNKGVVEQVGKRKMQGEILEGNKEGGKRNKPNMEMENLWSNESAEAVEQPRQSQ